MKRVVTPTRSAGAKVCGAKSRRELHRKSHRVVL